MLCEFYTATQSRATSGNMYYSFNHGNTHFIALDSEASSFSAQVEWAKKDLQQINRTITLWVIGFWHRPWYCSSTGMMCVGQGAPSASCVQDNFLLTFNLQFMRTQAKTCRRLWKISSIARR
jgi:hypothetical protein